MPSSICISSGHGKYIRGAAGYLDEVDEARRVTEKVATYLRSAGVTVKTFHDDTSHDQGTNLNTIVNWHNKQSRDLDVSVHFNAYQTTSKPMGSEVLYVSSAGSEVADEVVDAICDASGLINRGPKKRTDLKFLNSCNEVAVLLEMCFVDSKADEDIYEAKFDAICRATAEALAQKSIAPGPTPEPPGPPVQAGDHPTLGKGDVGPEVEHLQVVLGVTPADGDFGSITEGAVKGFQRACGLGADGVCGPGTWAEVDELEERKAAGGERTFAGARRQDLRPGRAIRHRRLFVERPRQDAARLHPRRRARVRRGGGMARWATRPPSGWRAPIPTTPARTR